MGMFDIFNSYEIVMDLFEDDVKNPLEKLSNLGLKTKYLKCCYSNGRYSFEVEGSTHFDNIFDEDFVATLSLLKKDMLVHVFVTPYYDSETRSLYYGYNGKAYSVEETYPDFDVDMLISPKKIEVGETYPLEVIEAKGYTETRNDEDRHCDGYNWDVKRHEEDEWYLVSHAGNGQVYVAGIVSSYVIAEDDPNSREIKLSVVEGISKENAFFNHFNDCIKEEDQLEFERACTDEDLGLMYELYYKAIDMEISLGIAEV